MHIRCNRGLLVQLIQLDVLEHMMHAYTKRTQEYLFICAKEVERIHLGRQQALQQMIKIPPKLHATPKPTPKTTMACPMPPTSGQQ